MPAIINIYKTAGYSDSYSKSGAMDDPIWPRSGFVWDGAGGQYRDRQLYARNDGDVPALAVNVRVADISGTSEANWGKVALTQAALAGAAPGGSVGLGDIAIAGTVTFWLRITVPVSTDPEDKVDLRVRTSASISSSSSSSSESSISTSSSSTSVSSTSSSSSESSSSCSSSSSEAPYLCDTWLLAVAHWPDNQIYIYEKVGGTNLLDTIATPGEYPDAVAMYAGDIIVADSITRKIYIYSGTTTTIKDSYSSTGGKVVTGFGILDNNLIHCELGDYPHGMIYVHEGVSSAIINSFESPTHMPHALTVIPIGDLFSADRWDHRIYKHSGATREIRSYYDAYALSQTPPIADGLGLAYDTCGNLLEYDSRAEKLYIHDAVGSPILATANYNIPFTDIACPVASSSSSSSSGSSFSSSSTSSVSTSSSSTSSSEGSTSSSASSVPWPETTPILNDVLVDGNFAYVACRSTTYGHGILVFDISDETNPTAVQYAYSSAASAITRLGIYGNDLYGANQTGVASFDISTPALTFEEDDLELWPNIINIPGIDTDSNYLYINSALTGLRAIDISDPTNLAEVAGHGFEISSFNDVTQHLQLCSDDYSLVGGGDVTCCLWGNWLNSPCHAEYPLYYGAGGFWFTYHGGNYLKVGASGVYLDNGNSLWYLNGDPVVGYSMGKVWGCSKGPNDTGHIRSFDLAGSIPHVHSSGQFPDPYNYQVLIGTNLISHNIALTSGDQTLEFSKAQISGSYVYFLRKNGISICALSGAEILDWTINSRGFYIVGDYIFICVYQPGNHRLEIYDISTPTVPVLVGTGTI